MRYDIRKVYRLVFSSYLHDGDAGFAWSVLGPGSLNNLHHPSIIKKGRLGLMLKRMNDCFTKYWSLISATLRKLTLYLTLFCVPYPDVGQIHFCSA